MSKPNRNDNLFWLEAIIDGAQVGTWLWNYGTGEAHYNERWAQTLGYSLAELEPLSVDTFFKPIQAVKADQHSLIQAT